MIRVVLKESDPLFGVLTEEQVGVNPLTGVLRMAREVLQEMRQYLLAAEGSDKKIREEKTKTSITHLANDPLGQKSMLILEPALIITSDVDIGKDLVYDFENRDGINISKRM